MNRIRLRHKLAVILPLGLGGLAFVGLLKDGHSATAALTGTRTIVTFSCGVVAAIVFWLLARWLDTRPESSYSLEDLIEMVETYDKPAHQYFVKWIEQLATGVSRSVQVVESQELPFPTDFDRTKAPTFNQIMQRVVLMADSDDETPDDLIELYVNGSEKTLQWHLAGDEPNRVLTLRLLDGPASDHPSAVGESTLMSKLVAGREDNPLGHSPERLAELNSYGANIRGRFWRTFLVWNLVMPIVPVMLVGFFWWMSPDKWAEVIALCVGTLLLSFVCSLLLGVSAWLTRIEVADGQMRFLFAGMTRRMIPLDKVRGYECMLGKRGQIQIHYGNQWYCPSGQIDPKRVVELLDACGIEEVEGD